MAHWYILRDGKAYRYVQYNKDGSESKIIRPARAIADGAVKGLTSILSRVSDQGGLIEWAGRIGIEAGLKAAAEHSGKTNDEIMAAAKEIYTAERERASNRGTQIHDAIERYIKSGEVSQDTIASAAQRAVGEWHKENGVGLGSTEHCVYFKGVIRQHEVSFGGTVDWICDSVILDYKTVEPSKYGKYWTAKASHCAQLAGYRLAASQAGMCKSDARCINLYISRITGEIVSVREWSNDELRLGEELVDIACRAESLYSEIENDRK